jgi:hypothetical protein
MEKLISGLSIQDIFQLTLLLEKKFNNFWLFKKFLI